MATKLQFYSALAESTLDGLTARLGNWTRFLDSASWMYKYPFQDQLLIHAQRPDATACAELELWNERFSRWVRRGTKGIALIDDSGSYPRLTYVFDVSDTEPSQYRARPIKLWEMRQEHKAAVMTEITKNYEDIDPDGSLGDTFRNIAKQLAREYYEDNRREIYFRAENSALEPSVAYDFAGTPIEQGDDTVLRSIFEEMLANSIAYTVMARCGLDPGEYFEEEDFQGVIDFNTPDMANALGVATSDLSEQVLRDIEITIRKYERQHAAELNTERSEDNHERNNHLYAGRGLSASRHQLERTAEGVDGAARQVRENEESVPQGTQGDNVQPPTAVRETIPASAGGGRSGDDTALTDYGRVDEAEQPTRQGERPDGLGSGDEQSQSTGRGNNLERTDLRIDQSETDGNTETGAAEEAAPISMAEQALSHPIAGENTSSGAPAYSQLENSSIKELLTGSPISMDEVDAILRDGGNFDNHGLDIMPFNSRSAMRIVAHFTKGLDDNAAFLKREYLLGRYGRSFSQSGKGFDFGNHRVSAWFDEAGISLAVGVTAKNSIYRITIPWENAAARINELMLSGQYVTREFFDAALDCERIDLADKLWFFYRDDMHEIPKEWKGEYGGHCEDVPKIKSLLDDDDERQSIRDRLEADVIKWSNDPEGRTWRNPPRLLDEMNDAMNPPVIFPDNNFTHTRSFSYFITQDEIDAVLLNGGAHSENKFRILSIFLNDHDTKEKLAFLKKEYGHGGGTWNQTDGWQDSSPGKGLTIKRGGIRESDAQINLTWNAVVKRIDQLIGDGMYMTRAELDYIPSYERLALVRKINIFYYDLPKEYGCPFPGMTKTHFNEYSDENGDKALNFYHPAEAEWMAISDLLDNPERVDAVFAQMKQIFENTSTDDRYYETRKSAYEALSAYREGTYTLFPGIENLPEPATIIPIIQNRGISNAPRHEMIEDMRESSTFIGMDASATVEQLSLFNLNTPSLPSIDEQRVKIAEKLRQEDEKAKEADQDIPVPSLADDTDKPLLSISNEDKERIAAQFADNPRSREAVSLVREIYGDRLGMSMSQAIKRIMELIAEGRFDVAAERNAKDAVREQITDYAVSDELIDYAVDVLSADGTDEPTVQQIAERVEGILSADGDEVNAAPVAVKTAENSIDQYNEIDLILIDGTGADVSKQRIYDYITQQNRSPGEIARFIRDEFGTMSRTGRLKDYGIYSWQSASYGITISPVEGDSYTIGWNYIGERAEGLINSGLYMKTIAEYIAVGQPAEQPPAEHNAEVERIPKPQAPEPDFDTIAQTLLARVMANEAYIEVLKDAKTRAALRNPCTWVLEESIRDHEHDEPEIYNRYFGDDDFNDSIFDFVLKQSWANRPLQETPIAEQAPINGGLSEIADHVMYSDSSERHDKSEEIAPRPSGVNFRITDDHLGEGGAKTKFRNNIKALQTLKNIEFENRMATAEEQEILSRYVGWGALQEAFDPRNKAWENEYLELNALLTPEEWESARSTTLYAHYTSPTVIRAIYETIERMGFKSGNILEPACGIGNFFGLLPESMRDSKLYGVEIDSVTARIAKQLYPKADIQQTGFENSQYPDAFFDVAIGNVPFGGFGVIDNRYKTNFQIHDYFFQRTLDKVRPGGIVAFITSKGTLDKKNPEARKYIAQRAELLGAVRLPNNAFLKNAGTEVTSDILFFQKRDRPLDIEPDWVSLGLTEDGLPVNRYFLDNPHMMLGRMSNEQGTRMYGDKNSTTCIPIEGADLAEQLKDALSYIEGNYTIEELDDLEGVDNHAIPADPNVKNFSYTEVDGTVYFRENSLMYPVDLPAMTLERIKGMIELRECVQSLIALQLDDYPDEEIKAQQVKLNTLYDGFIAEFGLISSTANSRAFNADTSYYLLSALEEIDEDGQLERKADMFTKRTVKQRTVITHVDTASEALAVSIGEKARVDLDYMSKLTGFEREKLLNDLQGVVFLNVGFADSQEKAYVTADEYLSGNVRQKLELARAAAIGLPELEVNVRALEAIQPKDLEAGEIAVRLGSTWIDAEYVQQFMYELLNASWRNKSIYQVKYHQYTGEWHVTGKNRSQFSDIPATVTYGTSRMNAYQIIDDTLNLRDVRVYDYKVDADGKERRVLNKKETMLAQQKQELIKKKFQDWIWQDPERRQALLGQYNEIYNSTRPREYDGSHIVFEGMNPEIELNKHQVNGVARHLYGGNTLYAHVVGAGKTFTMVAAAMESKRLGLCHKSLFAVPNHLTEQWATEFLRLYPSANILVATKRDFEMRNRKKFCAKIATGDYDAVIIGHTQLEKIPMSRERQERQVREQIWEIEQGIRELKETNGERFSIKQLEKLKRGLENRLAKLLDSKRRDDVVTFEQLGVDRLYVDEAHGFKNLFLYTKMRNVAGLSTSEAQKSSDLFMKCRYIDELTDNKGVIFATGTPISNSMSEMYTMQRYLQYDTLAAKKLTHFDSWASIFGETVTSIELAPEGTGYRARTRFAKFHNLPELMVIFKQVADIQTADMLNLPVPESKFENIIVEPSDIQKEMVQELSERAADIHAGKVDSSVDNMLKVTTDGRKIGLDQRLMNPLLPDHEGSKVNACTDNVFRIWNDTRADRLTQLVFCDFSTPNKDGRFNVYEDMRAKLLERGIPESEIAFIHDADTEVRKKELFAKVRQGKVRVLFGSTFKMGAGTNVQDKLIAIHDVDCPWRPADLDQRAGRIIRQGNKNAQVWVYRYATSSTFDSYLWQTVQKKQEFIAQIMSSKSPVRSCEDVDETAVRPDRA